MKSLIRDRQVVDPLRLARAFRSLLEAEDDGWRWIVYRSCCDANGVEIPGAPLTCVCTLWRASTGGRGQRLPMTSQVYIEEAIERGVARYVEPQRLVDSMLGRRPVELQDAPLVEGGQGRSAGEVRRNARATIGAGVLLLIALCMAALIAWGCP